MLSTTDNQSAYVNYGQIIQYIENCRFYKSNALANWSKKENADPWLIAVAMTDDYIIVTFEQPSKDLSRKNPRKKIKIPDVAKHFSAQCISLFDFMRAMNFKL